MVSWPTPELLQFSGTRVSLNSTEKVTPYATAVVLRLYVYSKLALILAMEAKMALGVLGLSPRANSARFDNPS